MAMCWKCAGSKQVIVAEFDGSNPKKIDCPECGGKGWIGSPPVVVPEAPPETILPPCDKPPELKTEGKGKGKPEHFFLKSELFEKCLFCEGTQKTTRPAMVDKLKRPDGTTYSGPLPVGSACPCVSSPTPGFSPVGLTVGQVEAYRGRFDILLPLAVRLEQFLTGVCLEIQSANGDHSEDLKRHCADVLSKCGTQVTAVRAAFLRSLRLPVKPEGAD